MSLPGIISNRLSAPAFSIIRALITLVLLSNPQLQAQYRVDTWTTDNGLPQNSITGLTQTPDQYLWLTTNDGLVRFDGNRFKIFNRSNTPQITTNRLSAAFADKSGRMWFQAEDGGILYYERGVVKVVAQPGELSADQRSPFFDDASGGVIVNIDRRPYQFRAGKFEPFKVENLPPDSSLIFSDGEGELWFHRDDAIYSYHDGKLKTYSLAGFSHGKDYEVAYKDRNNSFWMAFFATANNQHSLLRIKDEQIQEVQLPEQAVNHFAEDAHGNLWLSLYTKGIFRIDRAAVIADHVPSDAVKPVQEIDGISTHASGYLKFDREGGLWLGTEKGLHQIAPRAIRVLSRADGLREDNVYPIFSDKTGIVWAGVWPNNLVQYENGKFKTFLSDETVFVTSLFQDSTNRLWFGTLGNLYYFENERPIEFTAQSGFPKGTEFSAITQTRDEALWFGTSHGVSRYLNNVATVYSVKNGLPDDYVVALLAAKDGRLWIGTRGGLAVIENQNIRFFTTGDGLASNSIRSLYEDAQCILWIGSYDGGLTRLKDDKFTVYTKREGLPSNGVFCILEDAAGWFWMNSNQGIYRVSRSELNDFADGKIRSLNSIAYNKRDGLLNVEGNGGRQPAGTKTADGRLWFPTAEGIAIINPETLVANRLRPPVLIEEVMIDRVAVSNEVFQSAVAHRSEITLAPGQNNLEINYTALSFINSDQLRFKYKLENLEADWNEVGTRRTAYYSYLPPGEYEFRVIAANRDGIWNEEGASIKVRVHPPFYHTWQFLLLVCLLFATLIVLIYYLRVRQLKAKGAQQEEFARQLIDSQERERGRIAAELHDGLSQSLSIIKNRAMLSLAKHHDQEHALEQLREISEASTEAIDEVKEIIYDLRPIQLDRLGLTAAIEDAAEKIAEINSLRLSKNIVDINNIFPRHSENSTYRIVQESLNNIVKHSKATAVELTIRKSRTEIRIIIKDDGAGFEPDAVKANRAKIGFGLTGMSERAKLFGGQTLIESAPGAGTKVSIILPLNKANPQITQI
ncbi:MAG TPA: two-component regulator propeller domain-containing protein [Pyrinomonadaceae bacterium]|nr:two-component regulator propeller domain-containing protein [Pyrinomonadaceae bacterium]